MRFYFRTPGRDYEWSGNILCDNDMTDMKYTDFVYQATKSAFGSVDLVLYRDEDHLFIRDIRFKYNRNFKKIENKLYWKQVAYQTTAFAVTAHIAYCDRLVGRISTMVAALLVAVYITGGVDNIIRLRPQPNNI